MRLVASMSRTYPFTLEAFLERELLTRKSFRTHAGSNDPEQGSWDVETYKQWMEDVKGGKGKGLAVCVSDVPFLEEEPGLMMFSLD